MSLKVLQIGKFYPPFKGGMETVLADLSNGLAANGVDVRVICSGTKETLIADERLSVFIYKKTFTIASQPFTPKMIMTFFQHVNWADVIHVHSPNPIVEILSLFIFNKKIVCTHHSDIHRQKLLKALYSPFWSLFKKKVKLFTVPTVNHIKYSDMINDCENKTKIISFGIREEKYAKIQETKRNNDRYLLFVGRLVGYKGLNFLIDAMTKVDSTLIIIGRGPLKDELQLQIESLNLSERVFIKSGVNSQEELNMYFKNAYAFILPSISKNENFGIVQLEAMLFSLPIIVTNIKSGVPLVGEPNQSTLLVEPESSIELAAAIHKLLDDPHLAKTLGARGFQIFQDKYRFETMIQDHIRLYRTALDE
jgi:glycosyltransferase involved in cell wall biosynthesis